MGINTIETDEKQVVSRKNGDEIIEITGLEKKENKSKQGKILIISFASLLLLALFTVSAILMNNHFEEMDAIKKNKSKLTFHNSHLMNRSSMDIRQRMQANQEQTRRVQEYGIGRDRAAENAINEQYSAIVLRYNRGRSEQEQVQIVTQENRNINEGYTYNRDNALIKPQLTLKDIADFTNLIADINGFYHLAEPVLGKRDPDLLFNGERIKLPDGRTVVVTQRDFLWRLAIEELKANYKAIFHKIFEFQKKIRLFHKRRVDIRREVFIMMKEVEKTLKKAHVSGQKLILNLILKELKTLPKR